MGGRERNNVSDHRSPYEVGKPCPEKPWMLVTTLDLQTAKCGACGHQLYTLAASPGSVAAHTETDA